MNCPCSPAAFLRCRILLSRGRARASARSHSHFLLPESWRRACPGVRGSGSREPLLSSQRSARDPPSLSHNSQSGTVVVWSCKPGFAARAPRCLPHCALPIPAETNLSLTDSHRCWPEHHTPPHLDHLVLFLDLGCEQLILRPKNIHSFLHLLQLSLRCRKCA